MASITVADASTARYVPCELNCTRLAPRKNICTRCRKELRLFAPDFVSRLGLSVKRTPRRVAPGRLPTVGDARACAGSPRVIVVMLFAEGVVVEPQPMRR